MQYLWTPWRMAYVSGAGESNPGGSVPEKVPGANQTFETAARQETDDEISCIFCDRVRLPESHDRESLIVLRSERNFVILNLYPYNTAHLMVVPYEHTADLARLDPQTGAEMIALAQRMVGLIEAEYRPDGFNLGMNLGRISGAGVADHLHLHVVPRWSGDTNFMPIVGSTKVMSEMPETTLDRLRSRLYELSR
jgi:ATP adenylyltransferase